MSRNCELKPVDRRRNERLTCLKLNVIQDAIKGQYTVGVDYEEEADWAKGSGEDGKRGILASILRALRIK